MINQKLTIKSQEILTNNYDINFLRSQKEQAKTNVKDIQNKYNDYIQFYTDDSVDKETPYSVLGI